MPANLDVLCDAAIAAPLADGPAAVPIQWRTFRDFQAKDEARAKQHGQRIAHWLRKAEHVDKTGFSRMKVGPAIAVICKELADLLQLDRLGKILWGV